MDLVNDGIETLRQGYHSMLQIAGSVRDALTSKTTQRATLMAVLLGTASTILFGLAAVAYLAFYHEYLPDQVTTVPVHLQYGYVSWWGGGLGWVIRSILLSQGPEWW